MEESKLLYQPKWSKAKRLLKSFTCNALRSRIDFHVINYRKAHDQLGRVVITVDKVEKLSMCTNTAEREEYYKEQEIRIQMNDWNFDEPSHNLYRQNQAHQLLKEEAIYGQYDFFFGLEKFLNTSIEESLKSTDSFILILCMIDRRVGKRTLRNMKTKINHMHPHVQYFHRLRCEAENIWITT